VDGLAKAYILSPYENNPFAGELQGMPNMDTIEEDFKTYFFRTKKGLELQISDDSWWPFDGEGNLLAG
jgi:hypothetical protein